MVDLPRLPVRQSQFALPRAAGLSLDDIVKVTIYLSDRQYRAENAWVRHEVLGEHTPALTIVITGIYDEQWLLEIEAIAAA